MFYRLFHSYYLTLPMLESQIQMQIKKQLINLKVHLCVILESKCPRIRKMLGFKQAPSENYW